jgi:glycine cleavage system H protein
MDDDSHVTIGVTEEFLRDYDKLVKIRLPGEGDEFSKDEMFGRVSVGHGSGIKLLIPLSGEILAVNDVVVDSPDAIIEDPYEDGWLIRLDIHSTSEYDDLMTREEYEEATEELDGDDELDLYDDDEDEDDVSEEDDEEIEGELEDFFDDDEDDY